jgi:putative membrane protein
MATTTRVPRFALACGGVLAVVVLVSGLAPADRPIWLAENALTAFLVGWLALSARSFPLSRLSYALILAFLVLHELGAHFTYPRVPYDQAVLRWTGISIDAALGFERNHWDRLVHAAFGLVFAVPLREVAVRIARVRGFWSDALPLASVMSIGLLYEFVEWAAAATLGHGPASAFVGAQGDPWDAHQDLLMATLGAGVSLAAMAIARARRDPASFRRDWQESVRVDPPASEGLRIADNGR